MAGQAFARRIHRSRHMFGWKETAPPPKGPAHTPEPYHYRPLQPHAWHQPTCSAALISSASASSGSFAGAAVDGNPTTGWLSARLNRCVAALGNT